MRSVLDAARYVVALLGLEQYALFAFVVDPELAVAHVEKLVLVVVLVPVEFAFDYAKPHHAVVHFHQCLVEPGLGGSPVVGGV